MNRPVKILLSGLVLAGTLYGGIRLGNATKPPVQPPAIPIYRVRPLQQQDVRMDTLLNSQDSFVMSYASDIGGYDWKIPIPTSAYLRYKVQDHHPVGGVERFLGFVTSSDPLIRQIATDLTSRCKTKEDVAQTLLDYVHQHIYDLSIEKDHDYVRFPIETIVERNGDCEDFAILGAALMRAKGLDVALLHFTYDDGAAHLSLAVHGDFSGTSWNVNGKEYYIAETTPTEWLHSKARNRVGESSTLTNRAASIYLVP